MKTNKKEALDVIWDKPKPNYEFDPAQNPDVISIIRQPDGNWKGKMQRFGTLVEVRQVSPMAVLEYLLLHDGKVI